jgi:hypothetical protein
MAPASRTGSSRTFPRLGHHHADDRCASCSRALRHEPGIVAYLRLPAARGRRGRWSLAGGCSTPPGSSGCSVPVAPGPALLARSASANYTGHALAARSEPLSRHTAPRVADGPRHRPRRSWRPWLGSAANRPNPKHGQVRFDAQPTGAQTAAMTHRRVFRVHQHRRTTRSAPPKLNDVEVRADVPNGGSRASSLTGALTECDKSKGTWPTPKTRFASSIAIAQCAGV